MSQFKVLEDVEIDGVAHVAGDTIEIENEEEATQLVTDNKVEAVEETSEAVATEGDSEEDEA